MTPPRPRSLLLCRLRRRLIALPAEHVVQVIPMLPLSRPPTLPRPIAGLAAIAGAMVPVVDPGVLFGEQGGEAIDLYAHLVQLRGAAPVTLCLLVDRAERFVAVAEDALLPVEPEASLNGCAIAAVEVAEGRAALLAVPSLLTAAEQTRVESLTKSAARRESRWAEQA